MDQKRRVSIGDFKFGKEGEEKIKEILSTNNISEGKFCKEFEEHYASYIGTKYSVICNSGTSALMLVLQALKYHEDYKKNEGKKIITTPLTYIATSNSIVTTGYEPVFADIKTDDFCIDTEKIKQVLEEANDPSEFAGILPVHLMGYACNMNEIEKISKKYGLFVVEDAAEAHGSLYGGKKTGSLGLAGAFSFYLAHNIQVGEMGAVTTNDYKLADNCRRLKGNGRICYCLVDDIRSGKCPHQNYEFHPRYLHDMIGYNFKAMEYQAAIGLVQLEKIDWVLKKRRENVKHLNDGLSGLSGKLSLPKYSNEVSYLGYPLVVHDKKISRNKLSMELSKLGVETRPVFNSIPTQQPAYSGYAEKYAGKVNNAEFIGNNAFYVGCHQYLTTDDLDFVISSIKKQFLA